jgi:hypothetical protein
MLSYTQKSALYTDIINLIWRTHTHFHGVPVCVSRDHKRAIRRQKATKRVARMEKFQKILCDERVHSSLPIHMQMN